jgi:flagellar basal body rod protein FlgF
MPCYARPEDKIMTTFVVIGLAETSGSAGNATWVDRIVVAHSQQEADLARSSMEAEHSHLDVEVYEDGFVA